MQDVATDALDTQSSRSKRLRESIWAYLRKQWTEAFKVELTSWRFRALFRRNPEQSVDEIAVEVCSLLQRVPDGCEDPQTVLFTLARTVIERNGSSSPVRPVSASAAQSLAAGEALLSHEIETFDRETRKMLGMHVHGGLSYHQIATEFDVPPARVLRILTKAYSHLRLRADPIEPASSEFSAEPVLRPLRPGGVARGCERPPNMCAS